MRTATTEKRCALYRHFDADDLLLYLGISDNPVQRGKDHARDSGWVRYAVRAEVTWYNSRAEALAAEKQAIKTLRPLFNQQHNNVPDVVAARDLYLARHGSGSKRTLLGQTVDVHTLPWDAEPEIPGEVCVTYTATFPADGDNWWARKIRIESDAAACVTLNRDMYYDRFHTEIADGSRRIQDAFVKCANSALDFIWSRDRWAERYCPISFGCAYAFLYAPLHAVSGLSDAIYLAEIEHDLSGMLEMTKRFRDTTDWKALKEIKKREAAKEGIAA